jgi:hypothetical protein
MSIKKIKTKILRKIYKFLKYRPSSDPFISGDGFRKMANHIHDETKKIKYPEKIKDGDIVFVKSDMLIDFFENIHPKIKSKYKLISHNSDENVTEKYAKYIDEKIIHWFAQNLMFENEKTTVIPIGIENKYFHQHGVVSFFKKQENDSEKINKILFGFNPNTNPEIRNKALLELNNSRLAEGIKKPLESKDYMQLLSKYKYVASPPGNGIDCIRTWEAIILGTVPVCLNNKNTELLLKLGSPVISLENYDIQDISILEENYSKLKDQGLIKDDICKIKFWENIIKNQK